MSGHGGTGKRPLENGLIFGFLMSEGVGTKIHDISGNRHHADLINTPTWEAGPQLSFDSGANERASLGAHADFNPVSECTLAAQIYIDPASAQGSDWARFIDIGNGVRLWYRTSTDTITIAPRLNVAGNKYISSSGGVTAGWYIIIAIISATYGKLIIDGVEVNDASWAADTIDYDNQIADIASSPGGGNYVTAKYRWALAWDRALSDEEAGLLTAQRRRV